MSVGSTIDLTFNPENQITTTGYSYDGAGNLTAKPGLTAISYTGADQLKSVTKAGTVYTYKHAGTDNNELLQQTSPDGTYSYAYGRPATSGVPTIETVTLGGSSANGTANVISDPTTGQALMLRTSTGMQSMYIYDGNPGSPIALITSGAYEAFAEDYDPFGLPTLTADSGGYGTKQNPYGFASGIQDRTTGWTHFGNRYYDPTTGTWTQRDTLDNPLSPLDANRYAYAGGDPINNTDPNGKDAGCALAAVGFATGAITTTVGFVGLVAGEAAAAGPTGGSSALAIGPTVLFGLGLVSTMIGYAGVFAECI